jgi:hypothetical protein
MLVRLPARVTIPIDNRPCFSHRFSPKGFNLNASEISLPLPDPSALAFRLKPILTVQSDGDNRDYCHLANETTRRSLVREITRQAGALLQANLTLTSLAT